MVTWEANAPEGSSHPTDSAAESLVVPATPNEYELFWSAERGEPSSRASEAKVVRKSLRDGPPMLIDGLEPTASYWVYVRACYEREASGRGGAPTFRDKSTWSEAHVTLPSLPRPQLNMPGCGRLDPTDARKISLSWGMPDSPVACSLVRYEIFLASDKAKDTSKTASAEFELHKKTDHPEQESVELSDLPMGAKCFMKVRAVGALSSGQELKSEFSAPFKVEMPKLPEFASVRAEEEKRGSAFVGIKIALSMSHKNPLVVSEYEIQHKLQPLAPPGQPAPVWNDDILEWKLVDKALDLHRKRPEDKGEAALEYSMKQPHAGGSTNDMRGHVYQFRARARVKVDATGAKMWTDWKKSTKLIVQHGIDAKAKQTGGGHIFTSEAFGANLSEDEIKQKRKELAAGTAFASGKSQDVAKEIERRLALKRQDGVSSATKMTKAQLAAQEEAKQRREAAEAKRLPSRGSIERLPSRGSGKGSAKDEKSGKRNENKETKPRAQKMLSFGSSSEEGSSTDAIPDQANELGEGREDYGAASAVVESVGKVTAAGAEMASGVFGAIRSTLFNSGTTDVQQPASADDGAGVTGALLEDTKGDEEEAGLKASTPPFGTS